MSAAEETISLGYEPRRWQKELHLGAAKARFALAIVGRQHGKSHGACMEIISRALSGPPGAGYALVSPYMSQTARIFWPRLRELLRPLKDHIKFRETDKQIHLPNGAIIYCLGADNADTIRGLSLRGVVLDEFDGMKSDVLTSVILPTMVSFGEDAFLLMIGTLSGVSRLWELYQKYQDGHDPAWFVMTVKASEAGIMSKGELSRYREEMGEAAFLREMECDANPPPEHSILGAAVNIAEKEGRVLDFGHDPHADVHSAWDLGIRDAMAIWLFEYNGSYVHVLAYHEYNECSLIEAARNVQKAHPGWHFGTAVLPHDAAIRDLGTGTSRVSTLQDTEVFTQVEVLPRGGIAEGLNAARVNISRCRFHSQDCLKGLQRLKAARYAYDNKSDTLLNKVVHDDNSHALDAFRYMSVYVEKVNPSGKAVSFKKRQREWSREIDYTIVDKQVGVAKGNYQPNDGGGYRRKPQSSWSPILYPDDY